MKYETELQELAATVKKCRKLCPWVKEQTVESHAKELKDEVDEVLNAIDKSDMVNLKEELGDVLWDTLMTIHIAETNKLFSMDEVINCVLQKMKRRKPYVFEGKSVTKEEAGVIWIRAKAEEKCRRTR